MTAPRKSPLRDKTLPALVISVLFILFLAVADALRPEAGTSNSAAETKINARTKLADRPSSSLPLKTKRLDRPLAFNTPGYWEQEARRSTDAAHAMLEKTNLSDMTQDDQDKVRNHYKAAQAYWEMATESTR